MTVDFIKKVIQSFNGVKQVEPVVKIEEDPSSGTRNLNVSFVTDLDQENAKKLNTAIIFRFKEGIRQNMEGYKHFKYYTLNLSQLCKDKITVTDAVELSRT
jgi:hypothetical protein